MRPLDCGHDDPIVIGRAIDQHEVPNRGRFLFEPDRDLDREEQDDWHRENADPETLGFDALGKFPPGNEKRVFHRNDASFAAGPTRRTNTSCNEGSAWLNLLKRICFSKQRCNMTWGSAARPNSNSH